MLLRLMSSAGVAATRSNTRLFLHSVSSSPAAPSFRALSRLFCSSARTFPAETSRLLKKPGASMVVVARPASIHSKVQDEKLPEWHLYEYAWCGPRWWMAFEFADIKKEYPKIPVESMGMETFLEEEQLTKPCHATSYNVYSVIIKADFKGQEVMKRTVLVMGRDVKELEATAERINKFRSLLTLLKDLIWNREQQ